MPHAVGGEEPCRWESELHRERLRRLNYTRKLLVNVATHFNADTGTYSVFCDFSTTGKGGFEDGQVFFNTFNETVALAANLVRSRQSAADACFASLFVPASIFRYTAVRFSEPISCHLAMQAYDLAGAYSHFVIGAAATGRRDQLAFVPAISSVRPQVRHKELPGGVATTFTGGVDSWFSIVQHRSEVTDLLYLMNVDVDSKTYPLWWRKTLAVLQTVASQEAKRLVLMDTNLRTLWMKRWLAPKQRLGHVHTSVKSLSTDTYVLVGPSREASPWSTIMHGYVISAAAHTLGFRLQKLYLPSTHTYRDPFPWGSHPMVDHLWSSDSLSVVHDGSYATRVAKTMAVASNPTAQHSLRVCQGTCSKRKTAEETRARREVCQNSDYVLNCGFCDKCLRTMAALELSGHRPLCTAFKNVSIDVLVSRIGNLPPFKGLKVDDNVLSFWREIYEVAAERKHVQLLQVLRRAFTKRN